MLLDPQIQADAKIDRLREWIATSQTCIFGRLAAGRPDLTSFCLLNEEVLRGSDSDIQKTIQSARLEWKEAARQGYKSAFIIVAASTRIYHARPDDNLKELALRLFNLYLDEHEVIKPDRTYLDNVSLDGLPGDGDRLVFGVGANFFSSAGDRRWWHDHRFPSGMAFSMNSPGHMAKAGEQRLRFLQGVVAAAGLNAAGVAGNDRTVRGLLASIQRLQRKIATYQRTNVCSLPDVLRFAMLTIRNASAENRPEVTPKWSKATFLARRDDDTECPFESIDEVAHLRNYDFSKYVGLYHTDHSIPSDYFRSLDETPPAGLIPFVLDFSYIYEKGTEAYKQMSAGIEKGRSRSTRVRRKERSR
ncbi:MAG: hypothetical protein ACJ71Q_17900 [Terriglobales bacterium]